MSRPHVRLLLSLPHFTSLYTPPRARFVPFQLPHNNICYPFSRFRIPSDDVTVNWSSVQVVCLEHVQPDTKRSGPLDWDSRPHPPHASMPCTNS
jgi:hypothetical protein